VTNTPEPAETGSSEPDDTEIPSETPGAAETPEATAEGGKSDGKKSGCGGFALSAAGIALAVLSCAVFVKRKRENP